MKHLRERMDVWTCGRVDEKSNRPYVHTSIRPHLLPALLAAAVLLFAACDSGDPGDFEAEYVIESYLVAAEPLPPVRLSRTAPVNVRYDFTALAVRGAAVRLHLLADDGAPEISHGFHEDPEAPGVYRPDDALALVQPLRRYRLEAVVPETGARITGTTVVPDTFRVVSATATEVVYQSTEQLEITVTRSRAPGRDQNYYIFVTESLDPREEELTPLAKAFFENQEDEITLEDLRVSGSPVLNEDNYDVNADGTLTIKYPWLAVVFYGPNRIYANAIDDNLYDYVRSQSVQQGGSTFSPGEIPNPIERVEGARGVFGSYARAAYTLVVRRPGLP